MLVDANCKFIYVDVGSHRILNDGGVFRNASLSKALEEKNLNIAAAKSLPGGDEALPFLVVAGDNFPLKS